MRKDGANRALAERLHLVPAGVHILLDPLDLVHAGDPAAGQKGDALADLDLGVTDVVMRGAGERGIYAESAAVDPLVEHPHLLLCPTGLACAAPAAVRRCPPSQQAPPAPAG